MSIRFLTNRSDFQEFPPPLVEMSSTLGNQSLSDMERPRSFFHGVGEQGRNRKDQARGRNSVELWRRTGGEGKGKKGQPPCPRARRMLITLMVVPLEVSCALSRPFVKQRRRSAEFRILRVDISDSFTVSVKRTLNDKTEAN